MIEVEGVIEVERAPSTSRLYERRLGGPESWVRVEYERCHPEDSFDDLKRRTLFSKEDKGLLREWLEAAERRDATAASLHSPERP